MRSVWVFLSGIVLGILLTVGWVQLARAFGQGMTGPMGPMMAQMMGLQAMADMMAQMMHDPKFMGSMASAGAQASEREGSLQRGGPRTPWPYRPSASR